MQSLCTSTVTAQFEGPSGRGGAEKVAPSPEGVARNLTALGLPEFGFGRDSLPPTLFDAARPNSSFKQGRRRRILSESEPFEAGPGRILDYPPFGRRANAPPLELPRAGPGRYPMRSGRQAVLR